MAGAGPGLGPAPGSVAHDHAAPPRDAAAPRTRRDRDWFDGGCRFDYVEGDICHGRRTSPRSGSVRLSPDPSCCLRGELTASALYPNPGAFPGGEGVTSIATLRKII